MAASPRIKPSRTAARPRRVAEEPLSLRALNRATLARQMLLERARLPIETALERLVGLQAQAPHPPYVGLWSRVAGFRAADLSEMLLSRRAVRVALMRSTLHLVSSEDCLRLRPLLQPMLERGLQGGFGKRLRGVDLEALVAAGRELLAERPLTFAELGLRLRETFPAHDAQALGYAIRAHATLVQVPPRGLWGQGGPAAHAIAEDWIPGGRGVRDRRSTTLADLVRRYLAAFGPASVRDVQAWSGHTRLDAVVDAMPELVRFRGDGGTVLLDLADAPRPDPETPAPPRFLPEWDNLMVSYADRARMLAPEHRAHVFTNNGLIPGTVLIDGFARASWRVDRQGAKAVLAIQPFVKVPRPMRATIAAEGEALLAFLTDAPASRRDVRFAEPR